MNKDRLRRLIAEIRSAGNPHDQVVAPLCYHTREQEIEDTAITAIESLYAEEIGKEKDNIEGIIIEEYNEWLSTGEDISFDKAAQEIVNHLTNHNEG